jgi:hypothetical protein
MRHVSLFLILMLGPALGWCAGCKKGGGAAAETEARMKKLFYPLVDYLEETKQGKGRPTEAGFKAYLGFLSKQKLADLGITNPETLFISPRDQRPFVINYEIRLIGGPGPLIWEQTGVNGRRYVYYQEGRVEELDEEALNKLGIKPKK